MNQNNFNAQAMQQSEIADNIGKISIGHSLATKHYDHGFIAVSIDVGGGLSEPLNQSGASNLHNIFRNEFIYTDIAILFHCQQVFFSV